MLDTANKKILANNLRFYVERSGKSQKDIAEILGVSTSTFNDWMTGKAYPRIDKIEIMANYFNIAKSDLIEKKDEKCMSNLENKEVMAENIRYYMKRSGKTQAEMAEIVGVSHSSFNEWINGKKYPRIDKIEIMAKYFNIAKSDLIEKREEIQENNDTIVDAVNVNEIYNRIVILCKMRGIKGAKMCTDIGVSKSLLTDMKMGRKNGVSAVNAQKIASYFGVTVAYLLGVEEPVAEISYAQAIDKLAKLIKDKEFCELFEAYSRLNAKNKQIVKGLITDLSV